MNKMEGALNTRISTAIGQYEGTNSLCVQMAERVQAIDSEFHRMKTDFAIRLDPNFNQRISELDGSLKDNLSRHNTENIYALLKTEQ